MAKIVEAIYENGVFKPLGKIHIKEHEKVKITISYPIEHKPNECTLQGIIGIAKDCSDTDLSIHHDKYLYGEGTD